MTSAGARKGLDQSAREIRCHGPFGWTRVWTDQHDLDAPGLERLPGAIADAGTNHQFAIGDDRHNAGMTVAAALAFLPMRLLRTIGTPPCIGSRLATLDRIVLHIENEKGRASAKMT